MKWLDRFFDTYLKRIGIVISLIMIVLITNEINNFLLGNFLSKIRSIEDIYSLIEYPIVYKTFIGSLLINYLDTYENIFYVFIKSIGIWRFGLIVISGLVLFTDHQDPFLNKIKRVLGLLMIILIVRNLSILFVGLKVLNAQDTLMGISNIMIVGDILKYSSLILIIGSLSSLIYMIYYYVIKK